MDISINKRQTRKEIVVFPGSLYDRRDYKYYIQINSPCSVNYDTPTFPVGKLCCKRPFMYINLFWTVMPLYVLGRLIQ